MPELQSIAERCKDCGTATVFAIVVDELDDNGERRIYTRNDRLPHGRNDCELMRRLERETWPTLW